MRQKKYSLYTNSGLEWLGDLPSHWRFKRLGSVFKERREKVSDTEYQPLSVTKSGVVPQLENAAKTDAGDNRKRVAIGDFVINSRSDRKGSSGLSPLDGSVSLISIVLEPTGIDGLYAHYLLRSQPFQEEFYRFGKGIVADLWSTNYSEMKNISIPVPDASEQTQIAVFLDHETAKIDQLIEKQQQLIDLLEEKRQAVISHAVTKGLNPDAPMKDSGVEWLGEVPRDWQITRVKFTATINPSKSEVRCLDDNTVVTFLPMEAIGERGEIDLSQTRSIGKVINGYTYLGEGDVLIAKITPCFENGKGAIATGLENGMAFATTEVVPLRPGKLITSEFLYYLLSTSPFRNLAEGSMYGAGGQKRVADTFIANYKFALPPLEEQQDIVSNIEMIVGRFDRLKNKAQKAIKLMTERRTALISAAVTGKIDVRGMVSSVSLAEQQADQHYETFARECNEV